MKKCLKLTALCGLFVLLLSIMLISNIPKTYASSSTNSYKNVLKPDYMVYSDWDNEEGEPFTNDLYFDVPLTIADFDYTTNNTITMDAYNDDTGDISFAAIQYSFDSIANNIVTYSWDVYDTSKIVLYWGAYAIQRTTLDTFSLVIDSTSQSGIEEYDVVITGVFRDVSPNQSFRMSFTIDNIDGFDLKSITDTMDSHLVGNILVLSELQITITNSNGYSDLNFKVASSISPIYSNVKEILLLNYERELPTPSIEYNFGAWLLENANAFLEFELLPGFSLSSLLSLLVGIPLLLFLFKMLLGG